MLPDHICHIRTHRECACLDTCKVQVATPAPTVRPTNRDIAALWAFCIVIAVIVGGTYQALRAEEIRFQQEARV